MFSPHNAQYKTFCGEFYRRDACFRFTFPHNNRSTHCFVGKSQGAILVLCSFFPTKNAVPTIMWGNHKSRYLLYVHFSPQKPQYPPLCGETNRCNACSRFIFPHKTRCTHHYVGKTPAHTPFIFSIYNIAQKRDFLQKFHKKK